MALYVINFYKRYINYKLELLKIEKICIKDNSIKNSLYSL